MSHSIHIIAADGAMAACMMGLMDHFRVANLIATRVNGTEEPLFNVQLLSETGKSVRCANGCVIEVAGDFSAVKSGDILFTPAFMISGRRDLKEAIPRWDSLIAWLKTVAPDMHMITTACSGSFVLAEAGLLNGKAATTAWWLSEEMKRRYPAINVQADEVCVHSGNVFTGAATTAYLDVSLALIEKLAGKHFARLVAKYMLIDNQRSSQAPYAILSSLQTDDPVVSLADQWIRANLSRDFKVDEVASAVAVSPRTLVRRFQNAIDESPQSFTQKLRVEKCKALLETTKLRFSDIVQRCGYSDESAFRRLFKRYCQLSPTEYRQRFTRSAA